MNFQLNIPENFRLLESLPEDRIDSRTYGIGNDFYVGIISIFSIQNNEIMPMDSNSSIIDKIHAILNENQGLIEVNNGITKDKNHFVYTIVKDYHTQLGTSYIITMHIVKNNDNICIQGQFSEQSLIGKRDSTIFNIAIKNKWIEFDKDNNTYTNWSKDPYNNEFCYGTPMNLSEKKDFDDMFPEHPLSKLRLLISYIIENN